MPESFRAALGPLARVGMNLGALLGRQRLDVAPGARAEERVEARRGSARDIMPCTGSTTAPSPAKHLATFSTAAFTSGSTGIPTPASSSRPMRLPFTAAREVRPVDVLHRQAHAVAMVGLRQHRHHQRGVIDGARHRAGAARHIGRIDRDAPEARLQPDQPAPAGGQAHRAADIGADMQRAVAGRACGARTGARAAGVLRQVPRIARERMEARHARRGHAEVGHRGLGKDDRARLAQPRGRGCILCHRVSAASPPYPAASARLSRRCSPSRSPARHRADPWARPWPSARVEAAASLRAASGS